MVNFLNVICLMNIINIIILNNSIVVERFLGVISIYISLVSIMIYLKVFGLVFLLFCFLDRMKEIVMIIVILVSFEGWNCNFIKFI